LITQLGIFKTASLKEKNKAFSRSRTFSLTNVNGRYPDIVLVSDKDSKEIPDDLVVPEPVYQV
jgi:Uma2 family endonuclease